jgi:hypothetical protein
MRGELARLNAMPTAAIRNLAINLQVKKSLLYDLLTFTPVSSAEELVAAILNNCKLNPWTNRN